MVRSKQIPFFEKKYVKYEKNFEMENYLPKWIYKFSVRHSLTRRIFHILIFNTLLKIKNSISERKYARHEISIEIQNRLLK